MTMKLLMYLLLPVILLCMAAEWLIDFLKETFSGEQEEPEEQEPASSFSLPEDDRPAGKPVIYDWQQQPAGGMAAQERRIQDDPDRKPQEEEMIKPFVYERPIIDLRPQTHEEDVKKERRGRSM